jgi:alpha-L-rhamnosidase
MFLCYGDHSILRENYTSMRGFMDFCALSSRDFIRCYPDYDGFRGFGDWLNIRAETPNDLIGTAMYAYCARLMRRIARVLGDADGEREYGELFVKIRNAFQRRYVTPDGLVTPQTQTAYLLALQFDLLPEAAVAVAERELVRDIRDRGWRISAGFVGSSYTNHVLTRLGRADVAFRLLFQTQWPSWLYPVTKGATTIWERWDGWTEENGFQDPGMNSFNHYAYGAIGAWLYQKVAGIDIDTDGAKDSAAWRSRAGYKRLLLEPHPGFGLTWASAYLDSVHGRIESSWKLEDDRFQWSVKVPANTTARARVPFAAQGVLTEGDADPARQSGIKVLGQSDGRVDLELSSGRYEFEVRGIATT